MISLYFINSDFLYVGNQIINYCINVGISTKKYLPIMNNEKYKLVRMY